MSGAAKPLNKKAAQSRSNFSQQIYTFLLSSYFQIILNAMFLPSVESTFFFGESIHPDLNPNEYIFVKR